jgi:Fe-S-cluster containining protein
VDQLSPPGPLDPQPVAFLGRNATATATRFADHSEANPCDGCSAPCSKLTVIPQEEPRTFRALDRLRFLVAHHDHELLLDRRGRWQLGIERACSLLDGDTNRCTVHGTPQKPKICVYYNPYGCWYKRNFHETSPRAGDSPDLIRIDLEGFERILEHVRFDDEGNVREVPSFDELRRLAAGGGAGPTL